MSYQIEHFSFALLNNLECDRFGTMIDFGNGVKLLDIDLLPEFVSDPENIKVREEAKKAEFGYRSATFDLADMSHYALIYQFVGEVKKPFDEHYDRGKPNYLFNNVIMSLRLAKRGLVGRLDVINRVCGAPRTLAGIPFRSRTGYDYPYLGRTFDAPYQLLAEDACKLKEIFVALNHRIDTIDTRTRIALDRFNYQYVRENELDRLIDIMVGFEALYGAETELTFRISLRGATHLRESDKERQKVYNCLSKAYSIRSRVVHGSASTIEESKDFAKGQNKDLWTSSTDMLNVLSALLREAIFSIVVDQACSSETLRNRLDKAIIRGSAVSEDD